MGTPAERERRQRYAQDQEALVRALESGSIRSDDDLRAWLSSHGMNPNGPLFQQYKVGGLNEAYGPSADPMKEYDLHSGMFRWRITNPDGSLKYPDWNPIPPVELARINGFYAWRDSPEGVQLRQTYGDNAAFAWYANHGTSPDMSWTGRRYGGAGGTGGGGGTPSGGGSGGLFGGGGPLGNAFGTAALSEAQLNEELAKQARLDTLNQQFQYERAAQEYGEARPLEQYLTNLYGDILGVQFDQPQWNLSDYFNQGMAGMGGRPAGYGEWYDENGVLHYKIGDRDMQWDPSQPESDTNSPPVYGADNPNWMPPPYPRPVPFDPNAPPPQQPPPDGGYDGGGGDGGPELLAAGSIQRQPRQTIGGGGRQPLPGPPRRLPAQQIDGGGDRRPPGWSPSGLGGPGRLPSQSIYGPSRGGAPSTPSLPSGGYTQAGGPSYDPNNPRTWAFLAAPASQIAADYDVGREQLQRLMPEGGERNLALGNLAQGAYGQVAGLRQGLVQNALAGISGLAGAKKGFNPGGYSGGAQALLGSRDTQRGQDVSRYGIDRGFQSGLMDLYGRNQAQSGSRWGDLFSGLGNLLANSGWWKNLGGGSK